MNKLEDVILYILSRAKQRGKSNLSKFELFKFLYLLEVESFKFTGKSLFANGVTFVRQTNGPISINVYNALNNLEGKYIQIRESKKPDYPYARHNISLIKRKSKYRLGESEKMFINSVLESYLPLSIKDLKKVVYETEPMLDIQSKEKQKKQLMNGLTLDFSKVSLDEDVIEMIAN